MDPFFSFRVDPVRSLVTTTLGGFFTVDDVSRFVRERNAAYGTLVCAPNQQVTLVDIRTMAIQPQDTVAAFQEALAEPRVASRRLAFVVSRSLSRLQIQRAAAHRTARYFDDEEAALAWLLEPDMEVAHRPGSILPGQPSTALEGQIHAIV